MMKILHSTTSELFSGTPLSVMVLPSNKERRNVLR